MECDLYILLNVSFDLNVNLIYCRKFDIMFDVKKKMMILEVNC